MPARSAALYQTRKVKVMSIIKLSKPFAADGREYTEFNLDYDNATGVILRQAEKQARKKYGLTDMYLPASTTYRSIVASLILKMPLEVLESLPMADYNAITDDVLVFFGGTDSDTMTETAADTTTPNTAIPATDY